MNQIQVCLHAASHFWKKLHSGGGVEMEQNDWRSPTHSQECDLKLSKGELQCPAAAMGKIYCQNVPSLPPSLPQWIFSLLQCLPLHIVWINQFSRSKIKYSKSLIRKRWVLRGRIQAYISREHNPLTNDFNQSFFSKFGENKIEILKRLLPQCNNKKYVYILLCFFFFFFNQQQKNQLYLLQSWKFDSAH